MTAGVHDMMGETTFSDGVQMVQALSRSGYSGDGAVKGFLGF